MTNQQEETLPCFVLASLWRIHQFEELLAADRPDEYGLVEDDRAEGVA